MAISGGASNAAAKARGSTSASSSAGGSAKKRAMQVTVVVRVRPALSHEKLQPVALTVAKPAQHGKGKGSLVTMAPPDASETSEFLFDKCYDEATPQRLLFQREIQPAITKVLSGVNTTVFAYGATGTGKTFTMEGSKRNLGMIPRSVKRLFEVAAAQAQATAFAVDMAYLEIYNDRVLDLLVPKAQQADLPIRQQTDGSIAVQGLTRKRIASLQEFEELYERGSACRARAATDLNPESSRSHSILMLQARANDLKLGEIRYGKLHLIDLAGSEDNRRTGNSGARLAESGKINMSLFVLGKVITALNSGDLQRIPFRDSKLTRLLQDSLGGSSHAVMICNVAQTATLYTECLQTLNYAAKARGIVNQVVIQAPVPVKKPVKADAKKVQTPPTATKVVSGVPKAAKPVQTLKPATTTTTSRMAKPVTAGVTKPVLSRPSMSPSTDPMENRLLMWKQSKLQTRTSLEKRPTADGLSLSTGLKRPLPVSTASSSRNLSSRLSITNTATRAPTSEMTSARVAAPLVKKPRQSIMPSPSQPNNANSRMPVCPKPVHQQAEDKENVSSNVTPPPSSSSSPSPSPVNLVKDLSPMDLAKKLIGVAIDLEKARHFAAAYCVFKRAYHVLPEENPKLAERLTALEAECPSAPTSLPSQDMSTAVYMQLVLEMNLLDVLNTGSQSDLTKLHSIGDKRAEKIVEMRPFAQLSDLLKVPGITDKLVQKIHDHHVQWC